MPAPDDKGKMDMAHNETALSVQLAEKLGLTAPINLLQKQYEEAIAACDDAWDAVLGAASSGLFMLTLEAHNIFRRAYADKLKAHAAFRDAQ